MAEGRYLYSDYSWYGKEEAPNIRLWGCVWAQNGDRESEEGCKHEQYLVSLAFQSVVYNYLMIMIINQYCHNLVCRKRKRGLKGGNRAGRLSDDVTNLLH